VLGSSYEKWRISKFILRTNERKNWLELETVKQHSYGRLAIPDEQSMKLCLTRVSISYSHLTESPNILTLATP